MDAANIHNVDVVKLHSFLNKYVAIKFKNAAPDIHGIIYTIDPVTENVVILKKDGGNLSIIVAMKHAISDMTIIEEIPDDLTNLDTTQLFSNIVPVATRGLTKIQLIDGLNLGKIPFTEIDDVFNVEGVSIHPPYDTSNCVCDNPTKLLRLQQILKTIKDTHSVS